MYSTFQHFVNDCKVFNEENIPTCLKSYWIIKQSMNLYALSTQSLSQSSLMTLEMIRGGLYVKLSPKAFHLTIP